MGGDTFAAFAVEVRAAKVVRYVRRSGSHPAPCHHSAVARDRVPSFMLGGYRAASRPFRMGCSSSSYPRRWTADLLLADPEGALMARLLGKTRSQSSASLTVLVRCYPTLAGDCAYRPQLLRRGMMPNPPFERTRASAIGLRLAFSHVGAFARAAQRKRWAS